MNKYRYLFFTIIFCIVVMYVFNFKNTISLNTSSAQENSDEISINGLTLYSSDGFKKIMLLMLGTQFNLRVGNG